MHISTLLLFLMAVVGLVGIVANVPICLIINAFVIILIGLFGALVGELFYSIVLKGRK